MYTYKEDVVVLVGQKPNRVIFKTSEIAILREASDGGSIVTLKNGAGTHELRVPFKTMAGQMGFNEKEID
jgi:hypothetical protein